MSRFEENLVKLGIVPQPQPEEGVLRLDAEAMERLAEVLEEVVQAIEEIAGSSRHLLDGFNRRRLLVGGDALISLTHWVVSGRWPPRVVTIDVEEEA